MLHGRTRRDTCRNGTDRRDATDTADGHHEKDAADLTDGRLGGRVTRKEIYETELPHRAVAGDSCGQGEDMLSGNRYHCQRAAPVCKYGQACNPRSGVCRIYTEKAEMA